MLPSSTSTANLAELHRHKQFRAIVPASSCVIGLHLFLIVGPQTTKMEDYEIEIRLVIGASNVGALLIYIVTMAITDNRRAHKILVTLNELNALMTCAAAVISRHRHRDLEIVCSLWGFAQFSAFLVFVGLQMNLLGFPAIIRARINAEFMVLFLSSEQVSEIGHQLEVLILAVALLGGETVGFFTNRVLRTMVMAREQWTLGPHREDARMAAALAEPDHSKHADAPPEQDEGQQREERHQQQLAKQQQRIPPEELFVMSIVGKGGMGLVYKGSWMGEVVALKVWRKVGDVRTLVRESQALARLRHPCICRAYGTTQVEGRHAIVMEYMANGALSVWLRDLARNNSTAPFPLICRIASQCASGLAYLHRQHYVHHDIKTGNVLLDELLNAKVSDFGLSRFDTRPVPTLDMLARVAVLTPDGAAAAEEAPSSLPTRVAAGPLEGKCPAAGSGPLEDTRPAAGKTTALQPTIDTQPSPGEPSFMWTTTPPAADGHGLATQHMGTLRYLAPEVLFEKRGTPESDVYAFGFLLWELTHQTLAFAGVDPVKVVTDIALRGERPPISLTGPRAVLTSMIKACWHPTPQQRPTMHECTSHLGQVLASMVSTSSASLDSTSTWASSDGAGLREFVSRHSARDVDGSENGNNGRGGGSCETGPPFAGGARAKRFSWTSRLWGPVQGSGRKLRRRPNASE